MRMSSLAFVVGIVLASVIQGGISITDRISNGNDVKVGDYPYVAAIRVDGQFKCGGFIYNERWIVTAASCVNRVAPSLVTVEAGLVSLDPPDSTQQRSQVSSIRVQASYNETTGLNDLALVEIVPSFVFDDTVNFIYYDEENTKDITAEFIGWGANEDGGDHSNQLKMASIHTATTCAAEYPDNYNAAFMVCAGSIDYADTQSPCQYDEGSPLVQNGFAVGIMSRNGGCGVAGSIPTRPTIFTRLSSYYSWLATTAGPQPLPN